MQYIFAPIPGRYMTSDQASSNNRGFHIPLIRENPSHSDGLGTSPGHAHRLGRVVRGEAAVGARDLEGGVRGPRRGAAGVDCAESICVDALCP